MADQTHVTHSCQFNWLFIVGETRFIFEGSCDRYEHECPREHRPLLARTRSQSCVAAHLTQSFTPHTHTSRSLAPPPPPTACFRKVCQIICIVRFRLLLLPKIEYTLDFASLSFASYCLRSNGS